MDGGAAAWERKLKLLLHEAVVVSKDLDRADEMIVGVKKSQNACNDL
jgi:hypothetical protein